MIRVRVDDFPHTKDDERHRHNLSSFREFHRTLSECIGGKRYLLGVIPKRCTPEDVLFLRNETDCVIGMHGIYHNEEKLDLYRNEFPPYLSQRDVCRELQEASTALQDALGRLVYTYMPPRNLIDQRTVSVLYDAGFFQFTQGPETNQQLIFDADELTMVPNSVYGRTDELLMQNAHIRLQAASEAKTYPVLTLHWTWETNIGLDHMKKFFSKIPKKYFEDFDDR